jgi:hypothetical protein
VADWGRMCDELTEEDLETETEAELALTSGIRRKRLDGWQFTPPSLCTLITSRCHIRLPARSAVAGPECCWGSLPRTTPLVPRRGGAVPPDGGSGAVQGGAGAGHWVGGVVPRPSRVYGPAADGDCGGNATLAARRGGKAGHAARRGAALAALARWSGVLRELALGAWRKNASAAAAARRTVGPAWWRGCGAAASPPPATDGGPQPSTPSGSAGRSAGRRPACVPRDHRRVGGHGVAGARHDARPLPPCASVRGARPRAHRRVRAGARLRPRRAAPTGRAWRGPRPRRRGPRPRGPRPRSGWARPAAGAQAVPDAAGREPGGVAGGGGVAAALVTCSGHKGDFCLVSGFSESGWFVRRFTSQSWGRPALVRGTVSGSRNHGPGAAASCLCAPLARALSHRPLPVAQLIHQDQAKQSACPQPP